LSMKIVNAHAAGMDVGSKEYYVAIGPGLDQVRSLGVYAEDLKSLATYLVDNGVTTVALESTDSYGQNLFAELIHAGLEVTLCNGRFTKHVSRKKTDVLDCPWIQKLHTLGLLPSCFLPDEQTEKLRTFCRHRSNMIDQKADTSHKMQKYLKLLNFRLDVVVRDITGLTGMKIIADICEGNLDPKSLARPRHYNCRQSEEEIAKALVSHQRADYLLGLRQEYDQYLFYKRKIAECDEMIKEMLESMIEAQEVPVDDLPSEKPYKRRNKNSIKGGFECMIVSVFGWSRFASYSRSEFLYDIEPHE